MNKLLTSHEQVPTVVIMRQAKLLFRVYGVGCRRVVPHSCENKAISGSKPPDHKGLSKTPVLFFLGHPLSGNIILVETLQLMFRAFLYD